MPVISNLLEMLSYSKESLDTKIDKLEWIVNDDLIAVQFKIDDKHFNFLVRDIIKDYRDRIYLYNDIISEDDHIYTIDFFGSEGFGISNEMKSKAIKVFSVVADILQQFIDKYKPKYFMFTAKEISRIRLYDRFAKMIEQKTPYKMIDADNEIYQGIKELTSEKNKIYLFSKE